MMMMSSWVAQIANYIVPPFCLWLTPIVDWMHIHQSTHSPPLEFMHNVNSPVWLLISQLLFYFIQVLACSGVWGMHLTPHSCPILGGVVWWCGGRRWWWWWWFEDTSTLFINEPDGHHPMQCAMRRLWQRLSLCKSKRNRFALEESQELLWWFSNWTVR